MARNAAIVAALVSTYDTGLLTSRMGTMVVVEIILFLVLASLTGVPTGAARFVLPGPAASKGMRAGIFTYSSSKSPVRSCQLGTFCCGIPYGCGRFVPIKSFEGFATKFLRVSLLDLNDGRRVLAGFQLPLRKLYLTKAAGQRTRQRTQKLEHKGLELKCLRLKQVPNYLLKNIGSRKNKVF